METNDTAVDKIEKIATAPQDGDHSSGFENVKTIVADKIHEAAEVMGEKATKPDAPYCMTQYGKQASELLEQSAEYVRQFDHHQANARLREYIGQRPGRSLLIAGGAGLIIGVILRRR